MRKEKYNYSIYTKIYLLTLTSIFDIITVEIISSPQCSVLGIERKLRKCQLMRKSLNASRNIPSRKTPTTMKSGLSVHLVSLCVSFTMKASPRGLRFLSRLNPTAIAMLVLLLRRHNNE